MKLKMLKNKINEFFRKFSQKVSEGAGSSISFILAALSVIIWALSGHHFKYSDSWELIINTSTTIITFLLVFIIQNTQNRDSKVINLKLNEILRSIDATRKELISLEQDEDKVLESLENEFKDMHDDIKIHSKETKELLDNKK